MLLEKIFCQQTREELGGISGINPYSVHLSSVMSNVVVVATVDIQSTKSIILHVEQTQGFAMTPCPFPDVA